mmetsp:Transcript_86731/g.265450  ORF Transcript_86731/g.265450 Transcript_86731/m.265450 type:complete len:256 (+) Transcript_86731:834-1601(+)
MRAGHDPRGLQRERLRCCGAIHVHEPRGPHDRRVPCQLLGQREAHVPGRRGVRDLRAVLPELPGRRGGAGGWADVAARADPQRRRGLRGLRRGLRRARAAVVRRRRGLRRVGRLPEAAGLPRRHEVAAGQRAGAPRRPEARRPTARGLPARFQRELPARVLGWEDVAHLGLLPRVLRRGQHLGRRRRGHHRGGPRRHPARPLAAGRVPRRHRRRRREAGVRRRPHPDLGVPVHPERAVRRRQHDHQWRGGEPRAH